MEFEGLTGLIGVKGIGVKFGNEFGVRVGGGGGAKLGDKLPGTSSAAIQVSRALEVG
jgi:hypothetical protein